MEQYKTKPQAEEAMIEAAFQEVLDGYLASNHRKKVEIITRAYKFAKEAHKGVRRQSGEPYILHPIEVALSLYKESDKIVALLHDVLEDTDATVEDLIAIGLYDCEIDAVKLLTKPHKEDYIHYVRRIAESPIARRVKMADLRHNMDISRLDVVTERDLARVEQYKKAYQILENAEKALEL